MKLIAEFVMQPGCSDSDDDYGGHSRNRKRRHRASRSLSNASRTGSLNSSDSQYSSARRTRHKKSKRKKARSRSVSWTTFLGGLKVRKLAKIRVPSLHPLWNVMKKMLLVLILDQPIRSFLMYVLCKLLFRCVLSVVILNYDDLLSFFFPVLIWEQHCWDCWRC
jgi:hypothetical protein